MELNVPVSNYRILGSGIQWIVTISLMLLAGYYLINIGNRYIERNKRIIIDFNLIGKALLTVSGIGLLLWIIRNVPVIRMVISSIFAAAVIAYVIDPFVSRLEKRNLKRSVGVLIVYATIVILVSVLLVVVVPQLARELGNMASKLPNFANKWISMFNKYFRDVAPGVYELTGVDILQAFTDTTQEITRAASRFMSESVSKTTSMLATVITDIIQIIFRIVLIMIIAFYFLIDKEMYGEKIVNLIPDSISDDMKYLSEKIGTSMNDFIRGRAIMAMFVGVCTMILLLILRVDFAIFIGMITMIADIVPYIGPALGFVPAVLFGFIESPIKGIIIAISYFLIQWAENNVIAPLLLGGSMGLNPLLIFLALIIGGGIFGVWGMILSIPVLAIIIILIEFGIEKYKERKLSSDRRKHE